MSAIGPRQRAAIARIDFKLPDGTFGQGTGFAVARDRILTAWHVLEAGTGHAAVFGGNRPAVPLGGARSDRLTHHKQDDWVLVECQVPDDIEPIELARLPVKSGGPAWRARAFPLAAPGAVYPSGHVVGWDATGLLDLSLDAAFAGLDPAGASGAPIFVEERAVGILVATRGASGGLTAIDADRILSAWPANEPRPWPVSARVPYELWVRQALTAWLTANNDARELAGKLTDLDPNLVTPARLARVLMTSSPEEALDFVRRSITGDNRDALIDLCCSLWVHGGAANTLSEAAFGDPRFAVLCCTKPAVIDHLCVAEGLAKEGLPRVRAGHLSVTYDYGDDARDALWRLVRHEVVKDEVDPSSISDDEVIEWLHEDYVAITVERTPPQSAIDGLRDRNIELPVVAFSRAATPAVAASCGGVFIEPFPDEVQERRANRRWAKRRSG
ncbi:MAG: serine protease [Deltaproteobacteria bacterium]|nr:serine protease [Kofleriaceae bacterium]